MTEDSTNNHEQPASSVTLPIYYREQHRQFVVATNVDGPDDAGAATTASTSARPPTTSSSSGNHSRQFDKHNDLELLQQEWARPKASKRKSFLNHYRFVGDRSMHLVAPDSIHRLNTITQHLQQQLNHKYDRFPLLQSLLLYESIRNDAFDQDGRNPLTYPKSNEGWISTLLVLKGRALDRILFPWTFTVGHAILYTCLQQLVFPQIIAQRQAADGAMLIANWWEVFLGVVLNSTLVFLLVFRLNRAADRFWTARALWGAIVAEGRMLISGLVVHQPPYNSYQPTGPDEETLPPHPTTNPLPTTVPPHRDPHLGHAIRWVLAFFVAAMESLRGRKELDGDMLAGILLQDEAQGLERSVHMPLYAVHHIRHHLHELYRVPYGSSEVVATQCTRHLSSLERKLDDMMNACGGAERIRATPLPIVYVAHLRTILLLTLLLLPYVYGPVWQWSTIPVIALAGFVWLGIEGTAREVENPFGYRVNDLPMDGYCKGMMATTIQELKLAADRELKVS